MLVTIGLIAVGFGIVIVLGLYAGKLLYQLKQQTIKQNTVKQQRKENIQSSIQTIAFAMLQQQCDLSEGVIRICRLLEVIPVSPIPDYPALYPHIHALFDRVKEFATHEARQKLTKKDLRKQDQQREQFESEYESAVLNEAKKLRNFTIK